VDDRTRCAMLEIISPAWVDEAEVLSTIGTTFKKTGHVLDTHTAVAAAASDKQPVRDRHTVVVSTASPYKFSYSVLAGMTGEQQEDEFKAVETIASLTGMPVHRALASLTTRPVRHTRVIEREQMKQTLDEIMNEIGRKKE
jgi:threonine synthase